MSTVQTYKEQEVTEGATHYKSPFFYKAHAENIFFYNGYAWELSEYSSISCLMDKSGNEAVELPQEPEQYIPKVGEACEYTAIHRHNGEYSAVEAGRWYECKEIIAFHGGFVWTSDNGLRLLSNTIFRPIKTEREKIKEWVESKIDCVEAFEMDQAILITKLLDLGALVIPESEA